MIDLTPVLEHPAVTSFLVFLLAMLLPAERLAKAFSFLQRYLEKWPILGALARIVRLYFEKVSQEDEMRRVFEAQDLAGVLVAGAEQMKASGKLDGPTAAAQVTRQLEEKVGLDEDTARKVTEGAVLDMKMLGRELQTGAARKRIAATSEQVEEADRAIRR